MLFGLLNWIGILFLWTWFIWPFVFVFSLVYAIASLVKDEKASMVPAFFASVSLLIIVAGITNITLHYSF